VPPPTEEEISELSDAHAKGQEYNSKIIYRILPPTEEEISELADAHAKGQENKRKMPIFVYPKEEHERLKESDLREAYENMLKNSSNIHKRRRTRTNGSLCKRTRRAGYQSYTQRDDSKNAQRSHW